MNDYSELKRLAEAAPAKGKNCWYTHGDFESVFDSDDSKYMAEAEPSLILALIAEVDALRKDADRYKWLSVEGNWVARMFGKWRAHVGEYGDSAPTEWHDTQEEAIDAAMAKGAKP